MINVARIPTPRHSTHFLTERSHVTLADLILLTALLALTLFNGWNSYHFGDVPFEDGAILMRYSRNLAETNQIVWNIGDQPVDGATDFLFMVAVAGMIKLGLNAESGVLVLSTAAHLLTIALVYLAVRTHWRQNRAIAIVAAGFLALGPGFAYIASYYGTTFFAFFAALTWYLAQRYVDQPTNTNALLFSFSGLLTGLTRPEGVLLAGFMLLALIFYLGLRQSYRVITAFVVVFALFGGAYFLWRWSYFHYPLPNPYYKKGQGRLHFGSLIGSIKYVAFNTFPFAFVFLLALVKRPLIKKTIFLLIPMVGFTGIWILMSTEGNLNNRFQYAILPLFALSWPALIDDVWADWRALFTEPKRRWLVALIVVLSMGIFYRFSLNTDGRVDYTGSGDGQLGLHDVGVVLSQYADRGYTLAATEAGLLPFYSGWRTVDTWGLNDQWITHNGGITPEYLESWQPTIIMFHAFYSPVTEAWGMPDAVPPIGADWTTMTETLEAYAEEHGYVLAAVYGVDPTTTHYYYVRPDLPDSQAIIDAIRQIDYEWKRGSRSVNYAQVDFGSS